MSAAINAGKRVDIAVDGYSGDAGFTEVDGKAFLSFPLPKMRLRPGARLQADGRDWIIEKAARSQFLRGFVVIDLRPANS